MFMLSFIDSGIVLSMFMLSFIDAGIVLSMFMLSFIFVIVCGLFVWTRVCVGLFIYVLSLEIQLSEGNGSDPITWSSLAIFLVLNF